MKKGKEFYEGSNKGTWPSLQELVEETFPEEVMLELESEY